MNKSFEFHQIATVHSCYKEKFGIPRQSGLSDHAEAIIEFTEAYNNQEFIRELDGFSHIWVVFVFHQHTNKDIKATVRPPRLGGNKRIGVFASRSSYRPNPVGMSVVKLNKIITDKQKIQLHVTGADLLDGTPVIDIKPYIRYADSIVDARDAYAEFPPEKSLDVVFSDEADIALSKITQHHKNFKDLIIETLSLDPRPAYIDDSSRVFGIALSDYNIQWLVKEGVAQVIKITELD